MTHSAPAHEHPHEEFSLPLFVLTIVLTLAGLAGAVRLLAPHGVWQTQFSAGLWQHAVVVAAVSCFTCFLEYFFHRYVLHKPVVPFLSQFYRQHTKHHSLTRIGRARTSDGVEIPVIENIFPMDHIEQKEASFFPWYSLAIFSLIVSPLLALAQWLAPSFPWFLSGFAALALALSLYEILHAIEHWPLDKWSPLLKDERWGWFWRKAYSFHLRHHAVIDCNESISGFFTLPLADWLFGTCIIPPTLYADGEAWAPAKFVSPRPCAFIRWCDEKASAIVARRRTSARDAVHDSRPVPVPVARTVGERVVNWLAHGLGLALSVTGLVLLVTFACLRGDARHALSFTVFGVTLVLLYVTSTLYHGVQSESWKRLLHKCDRAAVFLLIAGTYTPFLVVGVRGAWGWSLFGVLWGLCTAGVIFQLFFAGRLRALTTFSYLAVGWVAIMAIQPAIASVPLGGVWLLLGGTLCYMLGAAAYRRDQSAYRSALRTGFVLSGTLCHLIAVLVFLVPTKI